MSRWATRRKARYHKPPQIDAVEDLTRRVAIRICKIVYSGGCACERQGRNMVCDSMKSAAQHAFAEIRGE